MTEYNTDTSQKLADKLRALLGADPSNAAYITLIEGWLNKPVTYRCDRTIDLNVSVAGGTTIAGNATSQHTLDANTQFQVTAKSFKIITNANVTAANTNCATFALVYNNGNGGTDTTIATINTATTAGGGSGNLTVGVPFSVPLTAANVVVPAGSQIQIKVTKAGTPGMELPQLSMEAVFQPR